jgi:hypothetical protein
MNTYLRRLLVATAMIACTGVWAADTPIDIKTDLKGQYFIVEKGGTPDKPTLSVKRAAPNNYNHYVKRLFDCKARTVQYLGEGETLEEMNKPMNGEKMTPIVEGSIPDQLAAIACKK